MENDHLHDIAELGQGVLELLVGLEAKSLRMRLDSRHASVGELVALALLELDRMSSEARDGIGALPTFARDFLNRRLIRHLLTRYPVPELPIEFERRLAVAIERLAENPGDQRAGTTTERLRKLLGELSSVLAEASLPAAGRPEH